MSNSVVIRRTAAMIAVGLTLLTTGAAPGRDSAPSETFVVGFRPGAGPVERRTSLALLDARPVRTLSGGRFALVEGSGLDTRRRPSGVTSIERPVPVAAYATPDDPLFPKQWNLDTIGVRDAWDQSTGSGATVAVLDTGVTRGLSDLAGTDVRRGIDLVEMDDDPDDDNGHGTHVTGTVAQTTNNGLGVAGVAYGATILPVKVLDTDGSGSDYVVADGVHWAVDNGADVINLSLGSESSSTVLYEAVQYAEQHGVTIVAAAGNAGAARVGYPAAYSQVLGVGAVGQDLSLAPYSNHGPGLDLVAPGGDMSRDVDGDGSGDGILQQTVMPDRDGAPCFCFYQGTSMAAPHVAGVAALLVSAGAASPESIRAAILDGARDLGPPGDDETYGAGLVQADAALAALGEPTDDLDPAGELQPPPADDPVGNGAEADDPQALTGQPRETDDSCPAGEVPEDGFSDVDEGNVHESAIDCIVWRGISRGVGGSRYAPASPVTRAQLATFLVRTLDGRGVALPDHVPDAFADDDGSAHEHDIDVLAAAGIVAGTSDRRFDPSAGVTRGQMASFLQRAIGYATGEELRASFDYFDDDDGGTHERAINALASIRVAGGTAPRTYSPTRVNQRDQMASFLARTLDYLIEQT